MPIPPDMNETDRNVLSQTTRDINAHTPEELDVMANEFKWMSFGMGEKKEKKLRPLVELETSHLENILITQRHIPLIWSKVILHILNKRKTPVVTQQVPERVLMENEKSYTGGKKYVEVLYPDTGEDKMYFQFVEGCGYTVYQITRGEARAIAAMLLDAANSS